jgi:hypothetical protein
MYPDEAKTEWKNTEHEAGHVRPVADCGHVDGYDGLCAHQHNMTPEFTVWACPLVRHTTHESIHETQQEREHREGSDEAGPFNETAETALHLFVDGDRNLYAAHDMAHALALWTADTGLPGHEAEMKAIPDGKVITIREEDDSGKEWTETKKTAAEWAKDATPGAIAGED